jgi:transcriptional regulator with XRE-family HTH domain
VTAGMTIDQRFAESMIRLRAERGWTVNDLAQRAGLRAAWINLLECGEGPDVTLADAYTIAVTLGVPLTAMLDVEGLRAAP